MHPNHEMKPEENDSDILRKLSPTLFEQKRSVDDAAPDGYFEEFPGRVMDRIQTNAQSNRRKIKYLNIRNVAIAAAIALILASIPYLKSFFKSETKAPTSTEIVQNSPANSETEIGTNDEIIATYIDESDLYAALSATDENYEISLSGSDPDLIVDYLIDEDVSNQMLIESLTTDDL